MTVHSSELQSSELARLSGEIERVANALARLALVPSADELPDEHVTLPEIDPDLVRAEIRARRLRARYFDEELFAEPAWDIFLDLFEARLMNRRISVTSACSAAAVPPTTAIRWISSLVKRGLLIKVADTYDGRRWYVELSPEVSRAMHRYFAEVVLSKKER